MDIASIIEPRAVSIPATATKLIGWTLDMYAYDFWAQVRSMGDATYVAIGTMGAQEDRMLGVGDYRSYQVPGKLVNIGQLFAISDCTSTPPVIELSGTYNPGGPAP